MIKYILVAIIGGCIGVIAASIMNYMDMKKLLEQNEASWKKVCEDDHQKSLEFMNKIQKARIEEMNNYHSRLADKQEEIESLKFQLSVLQSCGDEDLFSEF